MDDGYILMVEDDLDDQYLMRQAIRGCSIAVQMDCVADGHHVLEYLKEKFASETELLPKLILLDLNMPSLNGKVTLQKIKSDQQFKHIPVVIFTTSNSQEDIRDCYDLGANSYIVKPLGYPELRETIEIVCCHWLKVVTLLN